MSKSKYTNTANAGRLRRRGQSVPKNLLTSEDRFIDGSEGKRDINAEGVGEMRHQTPKAFANCSFKRRRRSRISAQGCHNLDVMEQRLRVRVHSHDSSSMRLK